ncbi:MAG: NAD(P)-dependent oxidoreductase [Planctomycetota bacterium]
MTKTALGWVGTGVMGAAMVRRLLVADYDVAVTSRTRARAQPLVDAGARWSDDAQTLARECSIVITMVGFPSEVEDVYLGPRGLLATTDAASRALRIAVDMTTSEPALAIRIAERARALGVATLDAPVSGGDVGAREGTLSIMVGGDATALSELEPIFAALGKRIVLQGGPGAGQHTKMVNQILIATNMIGVCEGMLYAERAGLDPLRVIDSVGSGAAGSWSVNNLAPRMLRGDFKPGFYVEHFIKDLGIALREAERLRLALPGLALARQLYEAVRAQGHGRCGTQALWLALRHLNGLAG